MRFLAFLLAIGIGHGADFVAVPKSPVPQGTMLRLSGPREVASARMDERTVPLFRQSDTGPVEGVMAIPVLLHPGPHRLEWLGNDGQVLSAETIIVRDAHFARQYVTLPKQVAELHSTPEERNDVGNFLAEASPVRYWALPLEPPLNSCTTSPFGVQRYLNGKATGDFHAGLDQRGAAGTPIHAIAGGVVNLAGQFALHGGTVGIDHGQGLESMYLHMSRIAAKPGGLVKTGDVIGYVGSTGRSTAPHLHWSLYANGQPVNPLQFMHLEPCAPKSVAKRK